MDTTNKFYIWAGTQLFLTATTFEWAQRKVEAFGGRDDRGVALTIELAPWRYAELMSARVAGL